MDRSQITLIRPLVYISEKDIKGFSKRTALELMPKNCPMDGVSKREDMRVLIKDFSLKLPYIRANLIGAIQRSGINGWKEVK